MQQLRAQGRKALVPYVVAGDPRPDATVAIMHALVEGGADIIELGVPFSDPMAEGPVIQLAHERALVHHVSLRQVLDMVRTFRERDAETPVVLMGYANPVEVMGYEAFANQASAAGVDGLLTVDMPPEEAGDLNTHLKRVGIDNIFLLAPTTTPERIARIAALATGYLYYVSLKGVTGAASLNVDEVTEKANLIRGITQLPLCVGFGIKDAASAEAIAGVADGVVVGSALVSALVGLGDASGDALAAAARAFAADLRGGVDRAAH